MGTIYYTTTGLIVFPYKRKQSRQLEAMTSIYDPAYHKRIEVTGCYHKDLKVFATHYFSKEIMRNLFPDYDIQVVKPFRPAMSDYFEISGTVPTDIQLDAIRQILSISSKQFFINLQTGYGKTFTAVYLSSLFKTKSLVMCFRSGILAQWKKTFLKMTTMDPKRIVILDSSKQLDAIQRGEFKCEDFDTFMCTPRLISSYCDKHGWDKLQRIFQEMGIGLKIYDEAHYHITAISQIDAFSSVDMTFYLSADFNQADKDRKKLYYSMFSKVPVIKPMKEKIEKLKYIVGVLVEYDSKPTQLEEDSVYNKYGFNNQDFMRYQFSKQNIFDSLDYLMKFIKEKDAGEHKILIFVGLIEHVDSLWEYMKKHEDSKYSVGRYHSKIGKDEKQFALEKANIIISTYQSFGVGIDVKGIRYVISIDQVNEIFDNQAAGRARPLPDNRDCFYFMLIDKGFKYSVRKLNRRIKYLKENKIKNLYRIKL